MNEVILNVKGMMCEGCENRVKNVVKNIGGVSEVTANHKTGEVKVVLKKKKKKIVIIEAIDDIGYEVVKEC